MRTLCRHLTPVLVTWLGVTALLAAPAPTWLIATDFPDLQVAIDQLKTRGGTLYLPAGYYTVTKTLDLTGVGHTGKIRMVGDGLSSTLVGDTQGQPIVDMTQTGTVVLENLRFSSKSANIGVLHARSGGGSAGICQYSYVWFDGEYSLACVYNCGSEVNRHFNCFFANRAPNGHAYIFTGKNYWGVKSPYKQMDESACNTDLAFYGCFWGVYGGGGEEVNLYLAGPVTTDVYVSGGDMSSKNGGRAAVLMDGRGTHLLSIRLHGLRFETQGAKHCIEAVDGYMPDVQITGNMLLSAEETIYAHGSGAKENWTIRDNMSESWKEEDWGKNGRAQMRFSFLRSSRVEALSGRLEREVETAEGVTESAGTGQRKDKRRFAQMSVIVDNESTGNEFTVRRSEDIRLPAATKATKVVAINEDGYRREYFSGGGVGTPVLLNLQPCDSKAIANPKAGDVVLDSGANTPDGKPTLAVFDGKEWRYVAVR